MIAFKRKQKRPPVCRACTYVEQQMWIGVEIAHTCKPTPIPLLALGKARR